MKQYNRCAFIVLNMVVKSKVANSLQIVFYHLINSMCQIYFRTISHINYHHYFVITSQLYFNSSSIDIYIVQTLKMTCFGRFYDNHKKSINWRINIQIHIHFLYILRWKNFPEMFTKWLSSNSELSTLNFDNLFHGVFEIRTSSSLSRIILIASSYFVFYRDINKKYCILERYLLKFQRQNYYFVIFINNIFLFIFKIQNSTYFNC